MPPAAALPALPGMALYLDFDGTLVELAETPSGVAVPGGLAPLLARLGQATGGATAIVSGRSLDQIEGFLPDFAGAVVGGHGAEWRIEGARRAHPLAGSGAVAEAKRRVHALARADARLLVEEKPAGVVLHYRQAPEREDEMQAAMADLAEGLEGLVLSRAKMAAEIRPGDVSKRHAVETLAAAQPFAGRCPIVFGDDDTDEDMIGWSVEAGGLAVKLGEGDSRAPWRLDGPAALRDRLADWAEAAR